MEERGVGEKEMGCECKLHEPMEHWQTQFTERRERAVQAGRSPSGRPFPIAPVGINRQ